MIIFKINDVFYPNINKKSIYINNSIEFCDTYEDEITVKNIETKLDSKLIELIEYLSGSCPVIVEDKIFKFIYAKQINNILVKNKWFTSIHYQWYKYMICRKIDNFKTEQIINAILFTKYYGLQNAEIYLNIYFAEKIFPKLSIDNIKKIFYCTNDLHFRDDQDERIKSIKWMDEYYHFNSFIN